MSRSKYARLALIGAFAAVAAQSAFAINSTPDIPQSFPDSPMVLNRHPDWVDTRAAAAAAQTVNPNADIPKSFPDSPMVLNRHPDWVDTHAQAEETQAVGATSSSTLSAEESFDKAHPYEAQEPSSSSEINPSVPDFRS